MDDKQMERVLEHGDDADVDRVKELAMQIDTADGSEEMDEVINELVHWILNGTFVRDHGETSSRILDEKGDDHAKE